ncbi:MAG: 12-oxophytodienoate reductase [Myxococcota bacterium]
MGPELDRRAFIRRSIAATAALSLGRSVPTWARDEPDRPAPDPDVDALFTPFAFGSLRTKNRFVMAPMSVGDFRDGAPTRAVAEHYAARAKGGVGLLITGGTIVDHPAGSAESDVGRMNARTVESWKRITESVHAHDARFFCQLWHQGPLTRPGIGPRPIVEGGTPVVTVASRSELARVIESFARSAGLAREAGFDGLELHGAHGYLLDAYLRHFGTRAASTNEVDPETFVFLLVKAVRSEVGPEFPIGFRFSRWSNVEESGRYLADPEALEKVMRPLKQAGVDVFHASRGYGPFWPAEYPTSPLSLAGWCRRITDTATITVGHVGLDPRPFFGGSTGGLSTLVEQLNAQQFDLVAVGRALLKNADWVEQVRRREFAALIEAGSAR